MYQTTGLSALHRSVHLRRAHDQLRGEFGVQRTIRPGCHNLEGYMYVLGLEHHEVCSTFAIRELRMRSPARTISGVDVQLGWLGEMEKTPNGIGIVYTTCRDKYKLLADFGKLVSK